MKFIDLHDWEKNKPKQYVNKDLIISIMATPKGEIFLKLIDGRQVEYHATLDNLMRELYEK